MAKIAVFFWWIKPKKLIKWKNIQISVEQISVQLEDKYYKKGKNAKIQKIYNNFHFLVGHKLEILQTKLKKYADFSSKSEKLAIQIKDDYYINRKNAKILKFFDNFR